MKSPTTINRRTLMGSVSAFTGAVALSSCEQVFPKKIIAGSYVKIEMDSYARPPSNNGYTAPKGRFDVKALSHENTQRQYHAYRSSGASAPTSILLLLHGAKRNGASMVDKWTALAQAHNILLVAPDSAGDTWDPNTDTPALMRAVLAHAKQAYGVGDVPVYGFGHSAGAVLMTLLSFRDGALFKRVAVHAGYLNQETAGRSKQYRNTKPPLAHFLGSDDHIFNVAEAEQSAGILAAHGQDIRLYVLRKHTHWYYDMASFVNKHAWSFLTEID